MSTYLQKQKLRYEGEVFTSKRHGDFTVLNYDSCNNVCVEFTNTKFQITTRLAQIRKGDVKDFMNPVVYGIGFLGGVEFRGTKAGVMTPAYKSWVLMLQRCYDESFLIRQPKNRGVKVCEFWHNFQNFAKWHYRNYPRNTTENYQLDKDLFGDSTLYSHSNCCYLPRILNKAIQRGKGVFDPHLKGGKFRAVSSKYCKIVHIFQSYNRDEVYQSYLLFKRGYILELIEKYNNELSDKIKIALLGQFH